jgi:hypothetical protein
MVYSWRNLEAVRLARNNASRESIRGTYGSEPAVQCFLTPLVADNALGQTTVAAGAQDTSAWPARRHGLRREDTDRHMKHRLARRI